MTVLQSDFQRYVDVRDLHSFPTRRSSDLAQSRMGVLPSAILIQREVGIETVIHYCCRDRNLLGMLSDILGAHAAGLRNILRSEEHTSELQSQSNLVCRLLLENRKHTSCSR